MKQTAHRGQAVPRRQRPRALTARPANRARRRGPVSDQEGGGNSGSGDQPAPAKPDRNSLPSSITHPLSKKGAVAEESGGSFGQRLAKPTPLTSRGGCRLGLSGRGPGHPVAWICRGQVCPSSFRFIRAQKSRTRRETVSFDAVMFLARVTKTFGAIWPHSST